MLALPWLREALAVTAAHNHDAAVKSLVITIVTAAMMGTEQAVSAILAAAKALEDAK